MNRPFSEPGWSDAPKSQQQEIWVRHVQGLYQILGKLRSKHPDVIFESCSGGGGRVDLGIGDQYRLLPTCKGNLVAVEYVNEDKDKVVLFVFLHSQQFGEKLLPN